MHSQDGRPAENWRARPPLAPSARCLANEFRRVGVPALTSSSFFLSCLTASDIPYTIIARSEGLMSRCQAAALPRAGT